MIEELTTTTERVDDTPLLMAHEKRMGIPRLLDESFGIHGNWQGLNSGWVVAGWLPHILSEGDHRMNHVQPWAERREKTLSACTGQPVRALDFGNDRLSTGLICLLSIALRVLTLLEFLVRRRLAQEGSELAGLYAGNPKRAIARPTAQRILEAFKDIALTVTREPPRTLPHITPLSSLQQRILDLLDFSPDIYTRLCVESSD